MLRWPAPPPSMSRDEARRKGPACDVRLARAILSAGPPAHYAQILLPARRPVAHQIDAAHARRDRERSAARRRVELSTVGADRARDVGLAGLLEKCPEGLEGDPADRAK